MNEKEKINNQLSDVINMYHQGLIVFPYWTDELLDLWESKTCEVIQEVHTGINLIKFYEKVQEMSSLLNDGHSFIFLPNEIRKDLSYCPIALKVIDNHLVIHQTNPDFNNYLFQPIKKINNFLTKDFLKKVEKHYWKNNINQSLKMIQREYAFLFKTDSFFIEFFDGHKIKIPFTKTEVSFLNDYTSRFGTDYKIILEYEGISIYKVSKKIIIKIDHFMSEEIVSLFYSYVSEYLEADELIFDLRNNSGGNTSIGDKITQSFFDDEFETEKISSQSIEGEYIASAIFLNSNDYDPSTETDPELIKMTQMLHHQYLESRIETAFYEEYRGLLKNVTVKILQDNVTYSAAENFIINFANKNRATLIGSTTAGSTGQPALFKLKTGGTFVVTAKKVEFPNGYNHHNIGIKPDIEINDDLATKRKNIDSILTYALRN